MKKTIHNLIFVLCAAAFISACGVKPGDLSPPAGSDPKLYPRQYPAKTVDE